MFHRNTFELEGISMKQVLLKSQVKKDGEVILHYKPLKRGENVIVLIKQDRYKPLKIKTVTSQRIKKKSVDSIYSLGKKPVIDSISDGSENHDNYLY
jgi:hypothetical protein